MDFSSMRFPLPAHIYRLPYILVLFRVSQKLPEQSHQLTIRKVTRILQVRANGRYDNWLLQEEVDCLTFIACSVDMDRHIGDLHPAIVGKKDAAFRNL